MCSRSISRATKRLPNTTWASRRIGSTNAIARTHRRATNSNGWTILKRTLDGTQRSRKIKSRKPSPTEQMESPMVRESKPKKVSYRLITNGTDEGRAMYRLLRELVTAHHPDLLGAQIALAWCTSWKPDVDGIVTLGKCKKASDLDRELAVYDFIILLRESFWTDPLVTDAQRRALLDHELCHAAVKLDDHGEPVEDERGRTVYRVRKHSIEEFTEIVERHGTYKRDLETFATALDRARHKADDTWVGYSSLREDLRLAGVSIPIEVIVAWSDDERREARTWALVRATPGIDGFEQLPACLAQAVSAERTT